MTYKDLIEKLVKLALQCPPEFAAINVSLSQHCGVINAFIYSGGYTSDTPVGHSLTIYDTATSEEIELAYEKLLTYLTECPHLRAVTPLEIAKKTIVQMLEALEAERLESARLRAIIKLHCGLPIE